MSLSQAILRSLSRPIGSGDYVGGDQHWDRRDPLETLKNIFPGFLSEIADKNIIDFGCGFGYQAVAMAQQGAKNVIACDIRLDIHESLARTKKEMGAEDLKNLDASRTIPTGEAYDVVVSLDCMEHVEDPTATLFSIYQALKPGGKAFVSFGPPWYAPYGAHMHFFTSVPWVHLLFPESTVLEVRKLYRPESICSNYREAGLGKLSIKKWEKTLEQQPWFTVESNTYITVRDLPVIAKIPKVRELFINNAATILRKRL